MSWKKRPRSGPKIDKKYEEEAMDEVPELSSYPMLKKKLGKYGRKKGGGTVRPIRNPWREWNMCLCGDGLKSIQKSMAEFEEKYDVLERVIGDLPRDSPKAAAKLMGCHYCKLVLDPENYMNCEENGHMVCGDCIIDEQNRKLEKNGGKGKLDGTCCALENLTKGHNQVLKVLLDGSLWRCNNFERGCQAVVQGKDNYDNHLKTCEYNSPDEEEKREEKKEEKKDKLLD